ncbi:hypothetical protein QQ020_33550 [Fulvivirgaceae bacterium BMA12]|uniref:Uncharacterized protein n=1 Tax=Agaribacillus aureus TaxID=3051825 RepID=A0ABT8LGW3_9BACT|nr:hypothetical protein [Fulvivirgaceae bacterium BMA12]
MCRYFLISLFTTRLPGVAPNSFDDTIYCAWGVDKASSKRFESPNRTSVLPPDWGKKER